MHKINYFIEYYNKSNSLVIIAVMIDNNKTVINIVLKIYYYLHIIFICIFYIYYTLENKMNAAMV